MELMRLSRDPAGSIIFRNAKWNPVETIDCEVRFQETGDEWYWFTASPNDTVAHGRELFAQLTQRHAAEIAPCTDEDRWKEAADELLAQRYVALSDTDWIACNDVALENQGEWVAYRQAWRDITLQEGYPFDVQIPQQPKVTTNVFASTKLGETK